MDLRIKMELADGSSGILEQSPYKASSTVDRRKTTWYINENDKWVDSFGLCHRLRVRLLPKILPRSP